MKFFISPCLDAKCERYSLSSLPRKPTLILLYRHGNSVDGLMRPRVVLCASGRERLSGILGVSAERASQFQDSFLQAYKGVQAFIQKTIQQCHQQGLCSLVPLQLATVINQGKEAPLTWIRRIRSEYAPPPQHRLNKRQLRFWHAEAA